MSSQKLPKSVVVHPLVLLSVVDHYNRIAADTKNRVVGVLLGSEHNGVVDVTNSFAGNLYICVYFISNKN
jgi:26S proteasome regulatory subunit N8